MSTQTPGDDQFDLCLPCTKRSQAGSGCDALNPGADSRHRSIAISSPYVHPSKDGVLDAKARLGGHKTGTVKEEENWPKPDR